MIYAAPISLGAVLTGATSGYKISSLTVLGSPFVPFGLSILRIGGELVNDCTARTEDGNLPIAQEEGLYPNQAGIEDIAEMWTACEQSDHLKRLRKPILGANRTVRKKSKFIISV
jgi:hypothetical protein